MLAEASCSTSRCHRIFRQQGSRPLAKQTDCAASLLDMSCAMKPAGFNLAAGNDDSSTFTSEERPASIAMSFAAECECSRVRAATLSESESLAKCLSTLAAHVSVVICRRQLQCEKCGSAEVLHCRISDLAVECGGAVRESGLLEARDLSPRT